MKPSNQQRQEIVEVKLWSLYLLLNQLSIYKDITETSLDGGPVEKTPRGGRVTFRFTNEAWHGKIKKLLYLNRIPVVVSQTLSISTFSSGNQLVAR